MCIHWGQLCIFPTRRLRAICSFNSAFLRLSLCFMYWKYCERICILRASETGFRSLALSIAVGFPLFLLFSFFHHFRFWCYYIPGIPQRAKSSKTLCFALKVFHILISCDLHKNFIRKLIFKSNWRQSTKDGYRVTNRQPIIASRVDNSSNWILHVFQNSMAERRAFSIRF